MWFIDNDFSLIIVLYDELQNKIMITVISKKKKIYVLIFVYHILIFNTLEVLMILLSIK